MLAVPRELTNIYDLNRVVEKKNNREFFKKAPVGKDVVIAQKSMGLPNIEPPPKHSNQLDTIIKTHNSEKIQEDESKLRTEPTLDYNQKDIPKGSKAIPVSDRALGYSKLI